MSAHLLTPVPTHADPTTAGIARRIAERRRLARQDRLAAQRAELHAARALLAGAVTVVEAGWIQDAWFAYRDERHREHLVGPHNLHEIVGRQVTGACLVGAIVQAGGGVPAARTGQVHRALELAWQALFPVSEFSVTEFSLTQSDYCPAPAVRTARVHDLTIWNDRPYRTVGDVTALLHAADRAAAGRIV
jgi:hypothetical protein